MISFGTDGWRGVIDDDFTEANAALVVQAAAEVWAEAGGATARERPLVVGYDTRFNSQRVATLAADILAANGWRVLLADRPVPTPLVSFSVVTVGAAGGLVVTASHNPARFNGIKLKGPFGGSASPEFTARVERALGRTAPRDADAAARARIEVRNLVPPYLERIGSRIAPGLRPARPLKIVADAMHGATGRLFHALVPSTLAAEVAPRGITVNCLAPGKIETARMEQLSPGGPSEEELATIPLGRLGTPQEFGDVACFLASDRARYVTGTTVVVDGGLSRGLF